MHNIPQAPEQLAYLRLNTYLAAYPKTVTEPLLKIVQQEYEADHNAVNNAVREAIMAEHAKAKQAAVELHQATRQAADAAEKNPDTTIGELRKLKGQAEQAWYAYQGVREPDLSSTHPTLAEQADRLQAKLLAAYPKEQAIVDQYTQLCLAASPDRYGR